MVILFTNIALAKMRAAVLYLPCGVLCTTNVYTCLATRQRFEPRTSPSPQTCGSGNDSALNPALRQALKRYQQYSTRHFTKPKNLTLKFDDLKWFSNDRLENFKKIESEIEQHDLKPIDNGWREFKGILPQTTELIVWELKEFAKYGDKQCEMWLNELMTKTNDPNVWTKTSDYIGHKTRK
jgi:hypothetical protein